SPKGSRGLHAVVTASMRASRSLGSSVMGGPSGKLRFEVHAVLLQALREQLARAAHVLEERVQPHPEPRRERLVRLGPRAAEPFPQSQTRLPRQMLLTVQERAAQERIRFVRLDARALVERALQGVRIERGRTGSADLADGEVLGDAEGESK